MSKSTPVEAAFTAALVRLEPENPIGAGFLITKDHLLTCAHCVIDRDAIEIDWPLLPGHPRYSATVVSRDREKDIAILRVAEPPHGAAPMCLRTSTRVSAHSFETFGFPSDNKIGAWATGKLSNKLANGWTQMEATAATGRRVERGFSGAPVWDSALGGVVGMVVAGDANPQDRVAAMIPAQRFPTVPDIRPCPPRQLPWWVIVLVMGVALAGAVLLLWPRPTFRFDDATGGPLEGCPPESIIGWAIRWEGVTCMGDRVWLADDHPHGWPIGKALAFQFDLTAERHYVAQIKYEAANLQLNDQLSGWVYLPADAPDDVRASCFVLEHTPGASPEWYWYQTDHTRLQPNQWTLVQCHVSDFQLETGPKRAWEQPLLVGFEFSRNRTPHTGTVYIDNVTLR